TFVHRLGEADVLGLGTVVEDRAFLPVAGDVQGFDKLGGKAGRGGAAVSVLVAENVGAAGKGRDVRGDHPHVVVAGDGRPIVAPEPLGHGLLRRLITPVPVDLARGGLHQETDFGVLRVTVEVAVLGQTTL